MKEESPRQKPIWISDSEIPRIKMHEGDRRMYDLLSKEGLFETIIQQPEEAPIRFEYKRVN